MTEARCAFAHCQAGGVILAGAPRVEPDYAGAWASGRPVYHLGCWAAEQRGEAT